MLMATRKKKGTIHPAILAIGGGAAGYAAARGAIYGGNKLAAMPNAPKLAQNFNVGAGLATTAGVLMVIFAKNLAVQSAGIGMVTTSVPEIYKDVKAALAPEIKAERQQRMRFNLAEETADEPGEDMPVPGSNQAPNFDLMQALAIAEDLED
jgi:hypothetical protein